MTLTALGTITAPDLRQSVVVEAPPEQVWALVGDPARTPEWSPVCHTIEWLDGADGPRPGARFKGHNRLNGVGWARECEITAYEPVREIAYSTRYKGAESTRWRYRLREVDGGTEVEESYQIVSMPTWVRVLRALPGGKRKNTRDAEKNVAGSLSRLKALVESSS